MPSDGDGRPPIDSRRHRGLSSWVVLAVLVAVFSGLVIGMFVVPPRAPADLRAAAEPTSAPAGVEDFSGPVTVTATFSLGDAVPVISRVGGTVTGRPRGSELKSGSVAFSVDLRPVLALHTDVPLFRDLTIGDSGEDVAALNRELTRLSEGDLESDTYCADTAAAWVALRQDRGVPEAAEGLALADIVWIPEVTVPLASWSAPLGSEVSPGDVVGLTRPQLIGIALTVPSGQPVLPGSRILTLLGQSTTLGDLTSALPGEFLAKVEQTPKYAQLLVQQSPPYTVTGEFVLVKPVRTLRVPPAAVFAVDGTRGCVQVGDHGVPVDIVGSGLGGTLVVPPESEVVDHVAIGAAITVTQC